MSTVHLHIGQCGNQLSIPLWQNFTKSKKNGTEPVFFSLDGYHRSVHIDSEQKVVRSLPKAFKMREANIIVGKRGRGSNFALGYHGMASVGDDHILDHGMEAIRKEVERCDTYSGIVIYHSISGGTGSGVGAHMIELLRDSYPSSHIMSCAVAPCISGESPLQNYNALLSLHWLQRYSDALIFLQNDYHISCLNRAHLSEDNDTQVSFRDINKEMANTLSGVLLPTDTLSTSEGVSLGQEPWELVRTLTPMPATKFISLSQCMSSKLSWEGLAANVLKHYPKYSADGDQTSCLSATVVARGDKQNTFMPAVKASLDKKFKKGVNVVSWNPYPLDCWTDKVNTNGSKNSCSLTLAVNSSSVLDHLQSILYRSVLKLNAKAYVHWYQRYGISQEIFSESVETLQTVISEYEEMTKN